MGLHGLGSDGPTNRHCECGTAYGDEGQYNRIRRERNLLRSDTPTRLDRWDCRVKQSRKSLASRHRKSGDSAKTTKQVGILRNLLSSLESFDIVIGT